MSRSASSKLNSSLSVNIREFGETIDDLSLMLHHTNLDEVDGSASKHKTDRFIPIRKCISSFSDKMMDSEKTDDKENIRGKEIK